MAVNTLRSGLICFSALLYLLGVFVWGILSCHVARGVVEGGVFRRPSVGWELLCEVVLCRSAEPWTPVVARLNWVLST